MSLRTVTARAICGALLAAIVALYFSHPLAAASAIVAAAAGAVAVALLIGGRASRREPSADATRAAASGRDELAPGAIEGAHATLLASELLEALMTSMREGLLVVAAGGQVVALNAAARRIFGERPEVQPRGREEGRRLSDLTRSPAILSAFEAALERGEQVEVKVETDERERRSFELRVAPLRSAGGARGAVGILFDITRLERLERVRQEFLSNVSHELRTPLTAIRTFVETLEAGAIDDSAHNRRFLSIIDRNAARMHSLIDDILELSAIEAGTVRLEPRDVRLRALVEEVLTAVAARASDRRIDLANEVPEEAVVRADPRRLEQMLTNLMDNAVKFNREGGVVRVSFERAGARDRVSVSDAGEGIAPEHLPRIFERFYRVDRARSRALGGTGLGLAIVKHLARAHGGEATVRSAPGAGSVFTVELPHEEGVKDVG